MARRAKRSVLTLRKKIEKDMRQTIAASSPGGRYYKATIADKVNQVGVRKP